MRLKPSSRSLAKTALKIIPFILFLSACSSSTTPSYLKEDITQAVKDISKKEYKLDLVTKLLGNTLWVYLPLEDIIKKPDKPEKYKERFLLEDKKNFLYEEVLKVTYNIKPTPEKEKEQEVSIDKKVNEKIFNVLQVIRRVLFCIDSSKEKKPFMFCIVTADIKNGFEIRQIFHLMDLKKLSYGFISQTEYQHRIIQDTAVDLEIVGDRQGDHLDFHDISMEEFIADQIQSRIKFKFQKPEVEANADIDKEVLKIVAYTLDIYGYRDFKLVEITNEATGTKNILNQAAILAHPKD